MDPKIKSHFKKTDPTLYKLLCQLEESEIKLSPRSSKYYFQALCADIISQQLSGKVADVFFARFLKLFPDNLVIPDSVLNLPDLTLRNIGISYSKVSFLKSLADYFVHKKIDFKKLINLSEEEVIGELTKIKGIGRWTAEMFCMFTLGRQDVFSAGDQGLKNAIKKYYPGHILVSRGYSKTLTHQQRGRGHRVLDPDIWSPYKTYACLILWRSLDLPPT
jgi:DNA-3-methyladenine glycosylase II